MDLSLEALRNQLGHFHPALVHFPVALLLTGAALEAWAVLRRRPPSDLARVLVRFGALGALAAAASGLALFRPGDFQGRTFAVAGIHRWLGLATTALAVLGAALSWSRSGSAKAGAYRLLVLVTAAVAGLTGHYGGWIVFGWGGIWTP